MMIQEAIRSGKPFKRKSWVSGWLVVAKPKGRRNPFFCSEWGRHEITMIPEEILADDWETKELGVPQSEVVQ